MMFGHFGWVAPAWLYAYAKAEAQSEIDRGRPLRHVRGVARFAAVGLETLLHYGRRTPLDELRRWGRLLGPTGRLLWRQFR
jgi:hypothetical protein